MFDLEEFYHKSHMGKAIEPSEVLEYISSFEKVVIWGGWKFRSGSWPKVAFRKNSNRSLLGRKICG